jgi:UDP-N-acetylmuramoyl-tripeptide--D-alanyl-D-alanine ligase
MPSFDPDFVAAATGGTWTARPAGPCTGWAIDTRTLRPGEGFAALATGRRDGHEFLAEAARRGAAAAMVSRPAAETALPQLAVADTLAALQALARAHRGRFAGRVVAVTGSAGKTSTKDLLAVLLGDEGRVAATEGNLNNHIGVPLTLLRLDGGRHDFAVVEAGISERGEMDVIAALASPDAALVTTVAPAHLEGLGTVEGVAAEKARLAAHLRPGGFVVLPAACASFRAFRELEAPGFAAVAAGQAAEAARGLRPVPFTIEHAGEATRIGVAWGGRVEAFALRRATPGMASNAVLAVIAGLALGVEPGAMRARIGRWRPAALRGEVRRSGKRTVYLDCYNANPASMADALEGFLAVAPEGAPRLYVVGCMEELGAAAAALHRAAGERWPLRAQDQLIVFGAHAADLAAGAAAAAPGARIVVEPGRDEAAAMVRGFEGAVFVKGSRRHALEDLLGGTAGGAAGREEAA